MLHGQNNGINLILHISFILLLSKLPGRNKRSLVEVREDKPKMVDFHKLVKKESYLVIDPLFSKAEINQYSERPSRIKKQECKKNRVSAYVTMSNDDESKGACEKSYILDKFEELLGKLLNERFQVALCRKNSVMDVCNQRSQYKKIAKKKILLFLSIQTIQQPFMVMCQEAKLTIRVQ